MPRSTIDAVGSNARCGSEVLTVNELSTTSVDEALRCVVAASAAAAQASDTSAASGNVSRHLLTGELLNWTPLLGGLSTLFDVLRPGEVGQRLRRGDRKSTRLNSSHVSISYAVFCLKKKNS